ncbi:hypothetical protein [Curtobacterium sp. MCBD17_040]|uniref:hypothetical protein n=1 Tax=Curtobacterium sp. MCBD17_040 TaxID=2175674 RepID=UPI0011B5DDA7|nr:hypothetical protein [Curtobacterium sp. MCBD17_040]WIB65887.1 hypothetical protein DEI94_17380 [Curtobacterium sp. MCBD17_040]
MPEGERGESAALPEPVPVWAVVPFREFGELRLPVFAVRRSDVAVLVQLGFQGVLQEAWVRRDQVTTRQLKARGRDRYADVPAHLPKNEGHRSRG